MEIFEIFLIYQVSNREASSQQSSYYIARKEANNDLYKDYDCKDGKRLKHTHA